MVAAPLAAVPPERPPCMRAHPALHARHRAAELRLGRLLAKNTPSSKGMESKPQE